MKAICFFDPKINNGVSGSIFFSQSSSTANVRVHIVLHGFAPRSMYAIHVHEFGDLSQGCMSTGKHFNPTDAPHGSRYYTVKRHAGDLINNLLTDENGHVEITFLEEMISLYPKSDRNVIGRSIVIHRFSDDYGLKGMFVKDEFLSYQSMTFSQLKKFALDRNYYTPEERLPSQRELVEKLEKESVTTGNAGQRIACAIIGITA